VRIHDHHFPVSSAAFAGLLCVVAWTSPRHAQPSGASSAAADTCRVAPATRLNITADSVGPLGVAAPLAELLRRCPAAYIDTTRVRTYDTNPQAEPRVVFPFNGLDVTAIAAGRASAVDSTRSLRLWVVRGSGAWLPRGLRSDATWRELRATYGNRGIVWVENGQAQIAFCAVQGLVFFFRAADYAQRDLLDAHKFEAVELQTLPDPILSDARIRDLTFVPKRKGRCQ
jgi:hypothetical protein